MARSASNARSASPERFDEPDNVRSIGSDPASDRPNRSLVRTLDAQGRDGDGDEALPLSPGTKIGRYVLLEVVGRGAMGVVYAAYDPELDRKVALKLLHQDFDAGQRRRRAQAHLLREARAMARLTDPNVIGVHDVGSFDERVFVAMEFVEGRTLSQWLKQHERSWQEVLDVFCRAGRGLWAAHRAGLVHADFKPDNVMVDDQGRVRVMDFGLARAKGHLVTRARFGGEAADGEIEESKAGIGTPAYMSPEQHLAHEPDARSDQFSFCVALFEALHGYRPFEGRTFCELSAHVLDGQLTPAPRSSPVPQHVRIAVERGLSTRPEARFETMEALLAELQRRPEDKRRRWIFAALGLGGGSFATGLLYLGVMGPETVCHGASDRMRDVWGNARHAAVRDAFVAADIGYAEDAWLGVERALDDYAARWVAAHTEACEATHVRHEQSVALLDRRMGCLGRALGEMDALVEVLVDADPEVIQRARTAVDGLPNVSRCADERVLLDQVVLPDDDADRALVEDLRRRLARARALEESGRYEEGRSLAESAVELAESVDYAPVQAEAYASLGSLLQALGNDDDAGEMLMQAFWRAVGSGDDHLAASVAIDLVTVVGLGRADQNQGLLWAEHARAQMARITEDPRLEARRLDAIGAVMTAAGRLDEAEEHHERARTIAEREYGRDDPRVAATLSNLGLVADKRGDFERALALHEDVLRIRRGALGERHPQVATALNNLGNVNVSLGRYEDAAQYFDQALDIRRTALGAEHPLTASVHNNLGNVHFRRGRYDEAEAAYRRAHDVWVAAHGSEHPKVATALGNLAIALKAQDRYDEALQLARRALDIETRVYGPQHASVGMSRGNIANILDRLGRFEEALAEHDEAIAVFEAGLGPRHVDVGVAHTNAAVVLKRMERYEEAVERFGTAISILEHELGTEHVELAYPLLGRGQAHLALGRTDEAIPDLERALALFDRGEAEPVIVADAAWALGRSLQRKRDQRDRARALVHRARATYAEHGRTDAVDEADRWLRRYP